VTRVEETVITYLKQIGQLEAQDLGSKRQEVTVANKEFLLDSFQRQASANGKIIAVAVALLCVLFAVGVGLVIYFKNSPAALTAVAGGNLMSLLGIVAWLRRLWFEKNTMVALYLVAANLSPQEAAKVIVSFHFRAVKLRSYARL
jgi:hypothetical protein